MNDLLRPLFNLLPSMWEKRWWGLAVAWVVALLGAIGVVLYHERYMASATVFVDTQTMLRPLMTGLSVQPDVGEQVNMLARTLLSRPNVVRIAEENRLISPSTPPDTRERIIEALTKGVQVKINGRDNLYQISYIGRDPAQALGVVRSVLDLFVHNGIATNQKDSAQALHFIDSQIAIYDKKLRDAENKLKEFKTQNPGYSGQASTDYYTRVSQLQDQLTLLQGQLTSAASSRDTLRRQLADIRPTLSPSLVPGANAGLLPQPSEIDVRIAAQRKHLDDLLQRYTDAYPDVIATRQTLARLERERQEQAKRKAAEPAPTAGAGIQYSEATNPVYQQLRISLAQADANVAALQSQVGDVQARLGQLRAQVGKLPKLDEQYVQLNRDYSVINENYQKLVQRREAAVISRDQDQSQKLDYFHVVDPPRASPRPLFPHRSVLIAFVLVFALALGALASYLLVLLFPTFRSARELRESTDRAVLGSISLVFTPRETKAEQQRQVLFMTGTGSLVVLYLAWVVLNVLHLIHY